MNKRNYILLQKVLSRLYVLEEMQELRECKMVDIKVSRQNIRRELQKYDSEIYEYLQKVKKEVDGMISMIGFLSKKDTDI